MANEAGGGVTRKSLRQCLAMSDIYFIFSPTLKSFTPLDTDQNQFGGGLDIHMRGDELESKFCYALIS